MTSIDQFLLFLSYIFGNCMLKYCWKNHKKIGKLFKKGKDQIDNSLDVLNIVSIIRKINESNKKLKDNES